MEKNYDFRERMCEVHRPYDPSDVRPIPDGYLDLSSGVTVVLPDGADPVTAHAAEDLCDYLTREYRARREDITVTVNGIDPSCFSFCEGTPFQIAHASRFDRDRSRTAKLLCEIAPKLCERFPTAERLVCDSYENLKDYLEEDACYVVVTPDHKADLQCVSTILPTRYRYLGMIGSKGKVAATFENLRLIGFTEEQISSVFAPIGLPIGAVTPAEIAVSVLAQVIQEKN
jgi:xanthine/CO dehydrogenase XdhC/CoxF family maturation factor